MKVLLISEPGLNGVFRHVEALTRYLLEQGAQVALAYSSIRGSDRLAALVETVTSSGGIAVDLKIINRPTSADLRATLQLERLVRRWKPDVIHAHSSKAGALARTLRLVGVQQPILYTPHAYYSMAPGASRSWIFRVIERWLGLIGTTIHVSDDEQHYGRHRLKISARAQRVIPNGVDLNIFSPASVDEKHAWRRAHGLPDRGVVLGTVGRYSGQKDPLTLYNALAPLLQREKNFWFAHLGEGELMESCTKFLREHAIQDRVVSIRYESAPAGFYKALDGFILPSRYEGLALSAVEALATDLPLILSDAPGNRDFLKIGLSHVWSAPTGDAAAFTRAVVAWHQDRSTARPCNHRAVAEIRFSRGLCYGRIFQEYKQQIGATASHLPPMGLPRPAVSVEKC